MSGLGRLQLYDAPAHGQGDLIRRMLSLSLSWVVVRNHFNRFDFETGSMFRICPSNARKYL